MAGDPLHHYPSEPDHRGGYDLKSQTLTAEADTYEQAYAQLADQVREDWSMLFVRQH